jgi:hypothetical protein
MTAKNFLDNLTKAVPYNIHTVLTDNGIQFVKREGAEAYWSIPFDRLLVSNIGRPRSIIPRPMAPSRTHVPDDQRGYGEALLLSVTR